jgi:hypothetical protein
MARETVNHWLEKADNKSLIEYWLSCDSDDSQLQEYLNITRDFNIRGKFSVNRSAIEAINKVAPMTRGNLLIVVSDDFHAFDGWDSFLLENLKGQSDYLVKTSDGYMDNKWLITLPIMDKDYYNRFGYIYNPEYLHMFSDTEMTCVGNMLGKVIDLQNPNAVFQHRHYSINLMAKDAINEKNDATWYQGKEVFLKRHENNFGLPVEALVMTYPREMFT